MTTKKTTNEAVAILATFRDGFGLKVLGVARRGTSDSWGLPGGMVEFGESLKEAARRELQEETGMTICACTDCDNFKPIFRHESCANDNIMVTVYQVPIMLWVMQDLRGDAGPVKFVTMEELKDGPFGEYNKALFNHIGI